MTRPNFLQSASLTGDPKFIDVWFVNFFAEPANMFKDRWNLFMLQMAYIVSISRHVSNLSFGPLRFR